VATCRAILAPARKKAFLATPISPLYRRSRKELQLPALPETEPTRVKSPTRVADGSLAVLAGARAAAVKSSKAIGRMRNLGRTATAPALPTNHTPCSRARKHQGTAHPAACQIVAEHER
jgi:hypothetical protein